MSAPSDARPAAKTNGCRSLMSFASKPFWPRAKSSSGRSTPSRAYDSACADETSAMSGAAPARMAACCARAVLRSKWSMAIKGAGIAALVVLAITFRVFDAKFWGVVIMGGAVVILFFLPWLDKSPVKSIRYRPMWQKVLYAVFVVNFFILGYLGVLPPFPFGQAYSLVGTVFYFLFFALMPIWSLIGPDKPVPDRLTFKPN